MIRCNSVRGQRVYASSPEQADLQAELDQANGTFNEGMDRLHRARQLSSQEQQSLKKLQDSSS